MFLNPLLLFGISAVSVPIIIHILNRRRFQRVVWAAMRFVRIAMEKNQRRIQWEEIILLAIRCLLVAVLALALSRPMLSWANKAASAFGAAKVTAVVLIDHSYSMSQIDGQTSKFEQAKRVADQIVSNLPSGSNVAVFLVSDAATPLVPQPTYDLLYARDAIGKATLSDRGSNLLAPLHAAIDLLKDHASPRKELYLVTDTQALGWKQTGDIQRLFSDARKEITANLIFVGQQAAMNLGVSDLRLAGALATTNRPLRFEAQVTNYGFTQVQNIPIKLSVDGDPPSEEAVIDAIPAGQSKAISLYARFKTDGLHTVTVRLAPDALPADDSRTIVVRVIKQAQILVIDGSPLATTPKEDLETKSYFLREALQPVPPNLRDQFYIQVKTIARSGGEGGNLAQAHLDDYDAVILCNVPDLPSADTDALKHYVRNLGGGLLVFPGPDAKPQYYVDQLFRKDPFLPAALGEPRGDAEQAEKFWTFQTNNYAHPIVTLWNDPAAGNLASARFFKTATLQQLPDTTRIVLRYNDGSPAIVEHTFGLGRVIMLAIGSDTAWSDLPVRPKVFIPLLHRMLASLLARQDDYLNVKVGQNFILNTSPDLVNKDALITRRPEDFREGGGKPVSETRRVSLENDRAVLKFENTNVAGVYDVQFTTDALPWKFSALRDPEESRLESLSQDQFTQLASVAKVIHWKPDLQIVAELKKENAGSELWFPLSIVALILATTETLLAHWFSRSK
ncbi:MAG: BatA domain-containing protein [Phycisphaerales bacterium]|nr:BatA domain-containing protein [Phycisphaerales bacterium]